MENALEHFAKIIESGRRAMAFTEHRTPGFSEPRNYTKKPAVGSGVIDLRELVVMPKASSTAQAITYNKTPVVTRTSEQVTLEAAVIQNSLVASAGATIIVAAERNVTNTNVLPVFYSQAGLFRVVEPATFGAVADGDDAPINVLPWSDATIDWPVAPSIAFRAIFSRAQQKAVGGGAALEENLLHAIVRGLADAADSALLAAIVAARSGNGFTLALAAARGLRFNDLGALVGTNGVGAAVDANGVLRANGISAELTRTSNQTVIGDFNKSAVAIHPEISVHIERMNVNGDMGCVVFANLMPLLPDPSAFWMGA